jgi:hypothetical protein
MQILAAISKQVPAYRFRFTREPDALLESVKELVGPLTPQNKIPSHQTDSKANSEKTGFNHPSIPES